MKALMIGFCFVLGSVGCAHRSVTSEAVTEPEVEVQGAMDCIPPGEIDAVRSLALSGDVEAMLRLVRYFHLCLYSAKEAVPWARMASDKGSQEAKYRLAVMLFWDDADRSNDEEAIDLLRDLATQEYMNAGELLQAFEKEHEANQALQTTPDDAQR